MALPQPASFLYPAAESIYIGDKGTDEYVSDAYLFCSAARGLGTHMAVPHFERLDTAFFCLIGRAVTNVSQY